MQDEERPLTLPIPGEVYFSGDRLRPLQLSAAELSNFTGSFHSEELDATYTLSVEGGRLRVKVPNNPPIPLDAAGPNEFTPAISEILSSILTPTIASPRSVYPRKRPAESSSRR